MKDLAAIQNIFTCFYMICSNDCLVIIVVISTFIIKFYAVTICFIFYGERLWRGQEVWKIYGEVKN